MSKEAVLEKNARKPQLEKPTPVDREVVLKEDAVLISVTDSRGVIEYCNEDFVDASGYEEHELVGAGHNIVRHPDMPRIIFKKMWSRISNNQNMVAVVKNMAKTGRYYWIVTDFVVKESDKGKILSYKAIRKPANKKAIEAVEPLYKKLREIEEKNGIEGSEKFLNGFLDAKDCDYDSFIESLVFDSMDIEEKKKLEKAKKDKKSGGFFNWFFFGDKGE